MDTVDEGKKMYPGTMYLIELWVSIEGTIKVYYKMNCVFNACACGYNSAMDEPTIKDAIKNNICNMLVNEGGILNKVRLDYCITGEGTGEIAKSEIIVYTKDYAPIKDGMFLLGSANDRCMGIDVEISTCEIIDLQD